MAIIVAYQAGENDDSQSRNPLGFLTSTNSRGWPRVTVSPVRTIHLTIRMGESFVARSGIFNSNSMLLAFLPAHDAERVFARGREDIVGMRVVDLLDLPADWQTPGVTVATALRSSGSRLEVRMAVTHADGSLVMTLQDRANHGPMPAMPAAVFAYRPW